MPQIQFERKWMAQCEAARRVRERFGVVNALDYLVGEKLLNFAKAADRHAEFAQELPEFLREIRDVFNVQETVAYVARNVNAPSGSARFSGAPSWQSPQLRRTFTN